MNKVLEDYEKDPLTKELCETFIKRFSVKEMTTAVVQYHLGKSMGLDAKSIANMKYANGTQNNAISAAYYETDWIEKVGYTKDESFDYQVGFFQTAAMIKSWRKNKQSYLFDKDFTDELCDTDTKFNMPHNIFNFLPYNTIYLDYSPNKELCEKLDIDGMLVQVWSIPLGEIDTFGNMTGWVVNTMNYLNGEYMHSSSQLFPNIDMELTIDELLNTLTDTKPNAVEEYNFSTENERLRLYYIVLIQSLLYLCSYEPDIRESTVSKQRYRKAKQNKKISKDALPEREWSVGVRFGEAFRKWTKDGSGRERTDISTGTGRHIRPHIRRAHWHRYWTGKRNSDEREMVLHWVSETFCGISADEAEEKLDTVIHKVG